MINGNWVQIYPNKAVGCIEVPEEAEKIRLMNSHVEFFYKAYGFELYLNPKS